MSIVETMTIENMNTRGHLLTEQVNVNSANLDRLSTLELVDLFNQEDVNTLNAIAGARVELASAIDTIADSLRHGGRLFYIGAGTSGRLGVLDAAECPPTFCTLRNTRILTGLQRRWAEVRAKRVIVSGIPARPLSGPRLVPPAEWPRVR